MWVGELGKQESRCTAAVVKGHMPLDPALRPRDPPRPAHARMLEALMRHDLPALCCFIALNALASSAFASPAADPPQAPPAKVAPPAASPQPAPVAAAKPWGQLKSDKGQTWPLTKLEITIGSDATSDVVLTDPSIAPHHCRISFANGNAAIEDLSSKSGTLVAGTPLKSGKPMPITNAVDIDPGAVTLHFAFLERGTVGPSATVKKRKPEPKVKLILPKNK
jgi:hypothetical protein